MIIRKMHLGEKSAINALALRAYHEFQHEFDDWPAFCSHVADTASLADIGDVFVAEREGTVVGVVGLVPPMGPRLPDFRPEWPIIRMLAVDPANRGAGIGRALSQFCIDFARERGWSSIALHTSPIMTVALPLYLRMGFHWHCDIAPISGATYAIYVKLLEGQQSSL